MAKHNKVGIDGENVAVDFIIGKGLRIVERNFRRPYGEIDIVSRETSWKYRFIEVKTVSWETEHAGVPHETYRPEENMHPMKVRRLMRVIQTYVSMHSVKDWQFDLVVVFLDQKKKVAKVRYLEDIVLGS